MDDSRTCVCEWLGSCVGTNVPEVEELKEPLVLPAILIEDGVFSGIEHNSIKRLPAETAIDYNRLAITKETSKLVAAKKDLVLREFAGGTLYDHVFLSAKESGLEFFLNLLSQSYDQVKAQYKESLEFVLAPENSTEEQEDI